MSQVRADKGVIKVTVKACDMFNGASSRFRQLMDPQELNSSIKKFGSDDKFYELTLYRYYYDDVKMHVVRVKDPHYVPVRMMGNFTPEDGSPIE